MLTKVAFGLAITLATVSGSFAAPHSVGSSQGVYSSSGAYVRTDPDPGIRFQLNRDGDRAHSN
jgi:hypothetical protein